MSDNQHTGIFRGESGCSAVTAINQVDGLDITKLAEKREGAPGEGTIYVFPVRSQLTWFRAKNTSGLVETDILFEDAYRAQAKATVYDAEGNKLATGHGTANVQDDIRFQSKLVEAAESRAVSRALDNAGFGCQLSAKTYDKDDIIAADLKIPDVPAKDESMPTMPGEAVVPASVPDRIDVSKMVDANTSAQPVDISDVQNESPPASQETPQSDDGVQPKRQRKKPEVTANEKDPEAATTTESSSGEQAPPAAAAPEEESGNNDPPSESKPQTDGEASDTEASQGGITEKQDSAEDIPTSDGATPESAPTVLSVADMMFAAIQKMEDIQPTEFDPVYFGKGPVDPAVLYISRKGKSTCIKNGDLQKAIRFFTQNQNLIPDVVFATTNPQVNGKTMRELLNMGSYGESAIFTWSYAYQGDNLALQAATLVYYQNTPELHKWEQKNAS